jgi:hypothetical protein
MRPLLIALVLAAPLIAGPTVAEDNEAGVPLAPAEAAGPWTLETQGHSVCVLRFAARKAANGVYAVKVPGDCGDALPAGIVGWAPAPAGMSLVGADGRPLAQFERWSNSLFVSKRGGGVDVQLTRGEPMREL